jgi:hypothetical protein
VQMVKMCGKDATRAKLRHLCSARGEHAVLCEGHGGIRVGKEDVEGVVRLQCNVAVGQGADWLGIKDPVLFDPRGVDCGLQAPRVRLRSKTSAASYTRHLQGLRRGNAIGADSKGRGATPRGLDDCQTASGARAAGRVQGLVACGERDDALVDEVEAVGGRSGVWVEERALCGDGVGKGRGDAGLGRVVELRVEEREGVGAAHLAERGPGAHLVVLGWQRHQSEDIRIDFGRRTRARGGR